MLQLKKTDKEKLSKPEAISLRPVIQPLINILRYPEREGKKKAKDLLFKTTF